ncbi:MAG: RnfABCDGE type electron transport complex subunit B [Candidatus Omnitrophica bacterium]|nr:RnfABCDGE type electron transport complex subunit B [Candidatus Omnitrophota bacterium]
MEILIPVITLGALGLIFGVGLAIASKKLSVKTDPRLEKIHGLLPGANCGACGGAGCFGFAEDLLSGKLNVDACRVSNDEIKEKIAKILGKSLEKKVRKTSVLHCHGGSKRVKDKFEYTGIKDCVSAGAVMGGPKACEYGCIGYGTCVRVCPFGAITLNDEDLPVIDESKCTACGKCVAVCPKKLFSLVAINKAYAVRCKSLDLGKKVMDVCPVGCIACHKCEKACPVQAIKIIDNLSVIDYNICDNRGECFRVCPTRSIAVKKEKKWTNEKYSL